jgi:hemolysin D
MKLFESLNDLKIHLKRASDIWRQARSEDKKRVRHNRRSHELEFLPAALEVIETPPSPSARLTVWLIIGLFVFAIAWSSISKTDVVVVAQGKVIPSGRSKVIQPLEQGIIRAIHVEDGQMVKKGDVLIELDPTATGADRDQVSQTLVLAQLEAARLKALIDSPENPETAFVPPPAASILEVQTQRMLLHSQSAEQTSRLSGIDREIGEAEAERQGILEDLSKMQRTLPLIRERSESQTQLAARQLAPRSKALELQQELVEAEQNLKTQRFRLQAVDERIASSRLERERAFNEYRRSMLSSLQEAQGKIDSLQQDLIKAENRFGNRVLTAPSDGYVTQLAVTTVGGVVTPAQELMYIVPKGDSFEIEAFLLNKDRGAVTTGDSAAIKVEAFPFTRYGTIPAKVRTISSDAVPDEKMGPLYKVIATPERNTLKSRDETVLLSPGMVVTLEIKTDERRIISFILSPIIRGFEEAARER